MASSQKPIGYWLKHLDRLINAHFDRTLADFEIGRRHWQVLNTLAGGPRSGQDLETALMPFWEEGAVTLTEILDDLASRGWVNGAGVNRAGEPSLTDSGTRAHAHIAARIGEARQLMLGGLTADDYLRTVEVLERMSSNVEAALTP
ncbi:MarR family transcriptional regulator [Actinomadura barringtoniae]|uniref:MarR family transcriptional regulator n=1 Tax=Actinomadura barringtoniae TaxID=1427535 RepID=A0A939P800_9ACTN|nr:MarR family transcriptional regulator [Actinomadura barringtoniae]MBO2447410.1 MarR family transcriptional regulator [Actinomadura barringtoniae]